MNTTDLSEQVSELRWLVSELRSELETLTTTPYPLAHRFLMRGLAKRLTTVAEHACQSLSQYQSELPEPCQVTPPRKGMTRAQQRLVALGAVRSQLRRLGCEPHPALPFDEVLKVLDELSRAELEG